MKKLLLSLLIFLSGYSFATHVVGGEITYQHLGGSSYIITCKLYRDCDPASVDFPGSVNINVDEGFGADFATINFPMSGRDTLSPPLDTCAVDPGICVEEAIYSGVVSLPPGAGGYHLSFEICCRNGSIVNIFDPLNAREAFYAFVPEQNIYLTNSSPVITNFPPVFVCRNVDLNLDFSATDLDGDSLVYSTYTPFDGTNGIGGPVYGGGWPPNNVSFSTVNYPGAGFTLASPLDFTATETVTIDPQTGLMSGTPPALGQYVVGIMVDEYRGDSLIGRITRDFQFNVVDCPPPQDAGIGALDACSGLSIDFINNSGAGANGFWWDFGTGDPADSSIVFEPSFVYGSEGTYPITLMAQKGTACADTAYYTLIISALTTDFTGPDTLCVGEDGTFLDASSPSANGVVDTWEWDFGDAGTSTAQNPIHAWSTPGDYTIQLISQTDVGCADTITKSIHIKSPPQAGIAPMPGCNDLNLTFTNTSDPTASGFWWDFGTPNPADSSLITNPTFDYTPYGYGAYTVTLVAQKGTACADTATYDLLVSNVIADFTAIDTTCTNILVPYTDASSNVNGTIIQWEWDFGGTGTSTQQNPDHGYTVAGDYDVELIVTSDLGCTDTVVYPINIYEAPIPQIGPIDACSGLLIDFINLSDPLASGFWWEFGTGDPGDTSLVFEPTFDFTPYGFGPYTITLVAQKGTVCETSTTVPINISQLTADFVSPDTICQNGTINFVDASVTQAGTVITNWDWDFAPGFSSQQNPSNSFAISGTIPVELIVTSDIGCQDTIIKDIEVMPEPIVDAGLDTAMCVSNPGLVLNGTITNATGGEWTGNGGVFVGGTTNLNAEYFPSLAELNNASTDLILCSTGNGYCTAICDTMTIQYLDTPTIDPGLDIEVCDDTTYIQLNASVQFASNILWTTPGSGSFDDPNLLNSTYTFGGGEVVAGDSVQFFIETFNFSGCPDDQDSLWVFFNAPPSYSLVYDDTVCAGFPIPINSNSTTGNGFWETFGDGTFNPDSSDATIYNHGTVDESNGMVTIAFQTIDNGGCNALYDTLDIVIIPTPTPDFTFTENCFGVIDSFFDASSSVDPIVLYDWTFETGQTSNAIDPTHIFTAPGIHPVSLIITSLNGCTDTVTYDVNSYHIPVPDFVIPEPCLEGGTYFYDSSTVVNATIDSWSWSFGDNPTPGTSTSQNPIYQYAIAGNYDIYLSVTSSDGCSKDTTINVGILPGPTAEFSFDPTEGASVGDPVNFTDESTPGNAIPLATWSWDFDDSTYSNAQDPTHVFDPEGEYNVQLIVVDEEGCKDTVVHMVPVYHGPQAPTAFSPDGDGLNDYFMILGGDFETLDFKVYNNWGQLIYSQTDPNLPGWDGTFKDKEQPIGVYVFVATVTTYDGVEHLLSGDVSLIR